MTWLHRYLRLLVFATLLLVAAGGMVTSTSSGLSVPDWPTTYGYSMFTFPASKMVGGIFYEHGHRLIASAVGALTIGLVLILWRVDPRRWMRRLGLVALAAVILQGVLGGLTVKYFLPAPISVGHAGLAQLFFGLTVALALFTSASWRQPAAAPVDDVRLRVRMATLTSIIFLQILLGATMRHIGAGLAIPDFPLAFGHWIPPVWSPQIAVHYAHRVGALVVILLVLLNAGYIRVFHARRPELTRPAWLLVVAVAAQVALGALVVLTGKQPVVNTLHVATGAMVLVTALVITLRGFRIRFAQS
jgi:cytochrome c oxidase assembly protein subunit 15